jgi:predicted O-methyltransferase YrrM
MAMLAGMQLNLFTALKDGPRTAAEIAGATGVSAAKLGPLLHALAVAKLLNKEGDRFANTAEAEAYLVDGRPGSLLGRREQFADTWNALLQTAASIRANAPQARHNFHAMPEREMIAFFQGQHAYAVAAGERLASIQDLSGGRNVLDAGGGSGGVTIGLCGACPDLTVTVADLPQVTPVTRKFLKEAGLGERVSTLDVDLVRQPPEGLYDVALIRNLIQVLSLKDAESAVRNVAQSLVSGGKLVVIGGMLDDSRLSPVDLVGSNLICLSIYDDGLIYTEGEYRDLLGKAGLTEIAVSHGSVAGMPGNAAVVTARKPE